MSVVFILLPRLFLSLNLRTLSTKLMYTLACLKLFTLLARTEAIRTTTGLYIHWKDNSGLRFEGEYERKILLLYIVFTY